MKENKKEKEKGAFKAVESLIGLLQLFRQPFTDAVFPWQNTITRYGTTTGSVSGADGENHYESDLFQN